MTRLTAGLPGRAPEARQRRFLDAPPIGGRAEQLDIVPATLRVRVTRRARYVCRSYDDVVVVAPAPDRPSDGEMPTEALIAHVVVSKFAAAQPLYRQVQILSRQGVMLDRSTLANWVGRAAGGCSRSKIFWSAP